MKNNRSLDTISDALLLAGDTGVEPVARESKSRMFPLHQSPILFWYSVKESNHRLRYVTPRPSHWTNRAYLIFGTPDRTRTGTVTMDANFSSSYVYPITSQEQNGPCSRIRTCDPLVPNQVRYQAALYTDKLLAPLTRFERATRRVETFCSSPDELQGHIF